MFLLERGYPNEFALRTVIRDTVEAEARAVFDKISMEQLIENARLAAEIAANPPAGLRERDSGFPETRPGTLPPFRGLNTTPR